jgi:glycine reductase
LNQTRLDGTRWIDPENRRLVWKNNQRGFRNRPSGELPCQADLRHFNPSEKAWLSRFPRHLGPPTSAGMGTTHVLDGAAVSVLAERSPGESRSVTGRVLEMSGPSAGATVYSSLQHLVVIVHTRKELPIHVIDKAYRRAGLKVSVYLGRAALNQTPESTQTFEAVGPGEVGREGLPRFAYVGQIFSRQRKPAVDEPILYGANTEGMLPIVLHPDEWLDGAIVPSLQSWFGGTETYFYQNHPVILELYRRHRAGEINFVGTIATIAGSDNFDRDRHCRAAANLVRWNLKADAVALTKWGGGLPHADLAETARLLEGMGIRTAVMVFDMSKDRRVESALLFNFPVNAIVYNGGNGTQWRCRGRADHYSHRSLGTAGWTHDDWGLERRWRYEPAEHRE